jgi:UDP-N-acetylglucosamine 2-epimerase (non-hydrolysing)
MTTKVLHVAGARPNFMKIAPLLEAFGARSSLSSRLVHTGQHYSTEMSASFFQELGIPAPDVDLEVGSGSHAQQTALILQRFEPVLLEERPDLVLVVGDVNSTIACALVAAKLGIPVAHVEAGLRSFDRSMPEEVNRVLTDAIAELLFVSEPSGVDNLIREGCDASRIHLVGNVMIDTLVKHRRRAASSDVLARFGLTPFRYGVVTLHRPANVDAPASFARMLEPILELSREIPLVFPVHPRTRPRLEAAVGGVAGGSLIPIDPLGYLDFLRLMRDARLVLTDSGGIQEETTILGVACVTLRDNTERPITVTHGTNRLGGTSAGSIRSAIAATMASPPPRRPAPPLWDGGAAVRVADAVEAWAQGRS